MVQKIRVGRTHYALVDDEDYKLVRSFAWTYLKKEPYTAYAVTGYSPRMSMHRLILGLPEQDIDHVDGDGLNNQKYNLREVTDSQNQQNRTGAQRNSQTGIRGVCWVSRRRKFKASLQVNRKTYVVGWFDNMHDANESVVAARQRLMSHSSN